MTPINKIVPTEKCLLGNKVKLKIIIIIKKNWPYYIPEKHFVQQRLWKSTKPQLKAGKQRGQYAQTLIRLSRGVQIIRGDAHHARV